MSNEIVLKKKINVQGGVINLADKVLKIMRGHVGVDNAITKQQLFKQVFGVEFSTSNYSHYFAYDILKSALHFCRKHTMCFIISKTNNRNVIFYVINSSNDVVAYHKDIDNKIKNMGAMKGRATTSVMEQWYKQAWQISNKFKKPELITAAP